MATTPPPVSSSIHTPPSPLHGAKYDSYQPYSLRRSTRSLTRQLKDSRKDSSSFSSPSSAQSSPMATNGTREEMMTTKKTEHAIRAEDGSEEGMEDTSGLLRAGDGTMMPPTTMLPTPAKTPRKRPQQPAHTLRSTARVLFPARDESAEGAMLSSRNRRGGRRFDDLMDTSNGDDQIEIYTDWKDRIPELDTSEDNPFWDHGKKSEGQSDGLKGGVKRKAVATNEEIEKAVKRRDDGLVYVFRGKKLFRKFEDEDAGSGDDDIMGGVSVDRSHIRARPFTRSSIKPRLLFPTEEQRREREQRAIAEEEDDDDDDVDEEAITEVDEEALNKKPSKKTFRNDGTTTDELIPPSTVSPTQADVSPLTPTSPSGITTTTRTTRSSAKKEADAAAAAAEGTGNDNHNHSPFDNNDTLRGSQIPPTHEQHHQKKKTSPFNDWKRTKSGIGGGGGDTKSKKGKNKREGDMLEKGVDEGGSSTAPSTGGTAKKVKLARGKA